MKKFIALLLLATLLPSYAGGHAKHCHVYVDSMKRIWVVCKEQK
jgi:hypothetical protein